MIRGGVPSKSGLNPTSERNGTPCDENQPGVLLRSGVNIKLVSVMPRGFGSTPKSQESWSPTPFDKSSLSHLQVFPRHSHCIVPCSMLSIEQISVCCVVVRFCGVMTSISITWLGHNYWLPAEDGRPTWLHALGNRGNHWGGAFGQPASGCKGGASATEA